MDVRGHAWAAKIRADVAHDKLLGLGYQGCERSTRRAVTASSSGCASSSAKNVR